jgi:hypothetical protein
MKPSFLHELGNEPPADRLDRAFRTVLTVSKDRLLEEAKEKREKARKKVRRKHGDA